MTEQSAQKINRRQFVALTTATAASAAVMSPALADDASTTASQVRLPKPSLARLIQDPETPATARLTTRLAPALAAARDATLNVRPLEDLAQRVQTDASIAVELEYPHARQHAVLYSAHNITTPGESIPATPAAITTRAPDARSATLRVTQRTKTSEQVTSIAVPLTPGETYVLAVPTASRSSSAAWRFTTATLDEDHRVTSVTNPLPAASTRCAFLSITVNA